MEGNLLGKDMTTDKTTGGTENKTTNKKYKDTVFRMLFNNKKEALGLYNNLFDTEYTDESLIDIVTLEDVLFIPRKNDVAFTMNGRFVVLIEPSAKPLLYLYFIAFFTASISDNSPFTYVSTSSICNDKACVIHESSSLLF
mgnify:CR=1 FL=1